MCIFGPHEPGLPAWGQEELKPGGLQGGGAPWVPRQSGEREQELPKWLPVPFSSPARDPTGHSLLSPSWARSRAMPTPHCGRGRGRTGGRAARRSELCVHAGPSAGEVLTPNGGGEEEGQRRPCFPRREPRTIERSCRPGEDGRKWRIPCHAHRRAWRWPAPCPTPHQEESAPSRARLTGQEGANWEDGRPSGSGPSSERTEFRPLLCQGAMGGAKGADIPGPPGAEGGHETALFLVCGL